MKILAIETSCDETGLAVLECSGGLDNPRFSVLGNQLLSQALAHQKYGGVYPSLAKRLHAQNLVPLMKEALRDAGLLDVKSERKNYSTILQNCGIVLEREQGLYTRLKDFLEKYKQPDIDAIAVTYGPGLEPTLWVGINFAKALSLAWNIPLIPVNHMEGHIVSVLYEDGKKVEFPALVLLISGAHTELILARDWGEYKLLGQTRDDAVGEAFDKVGRMLGLPYPGGPEISKLAEIKRKNLSHIYSTILQNCGIDSRKVWPSKPTSEIKLPRPMIDSNDYDFSFSGLKTAVLYAIRNKKLTQHDKEVIALEFENAITDVLLSKTKRALREYEFKTLIVAGGVAANKHLRDTFYTLKIKTRIPHTDVTGDNGIMIGIAGYLNFLSKRNSENTSGSYQDIRAEGSASVGSRQKSALATGIERR